MTGKEYLAKLVAREAEIAARAFDAKPLPDIKPSGNYLARLTIGQLVAAEKFFAGNVEYIEECARRETWLDVVEPLAPIVTVQDAIDMPETVFNNWAEDNGDPLSQALWTQALLEYLPTGQLTIARLKVRDAASQLVKASMDASLSRAYMLELGETNDKYAMLAGAVLVAGKRGGVKLTPAQNTRLNRMVAGEFLDMVYSQFASGDRGTLQGVKPPDHVGANAMRRDASWVDKMDAAQHMRELKWKVGMTQ